MIVATNGYCVRNPGGATGWSYVFEDHRWQAGGLVRGTTMVGELMAVLMLLKQFPDEDLTIQTNSSYIVGACTMWKRSWQRNGYIRDDGTKRPNTQFLIPIHHLLDTAKGDIEFVKVPDRDVNNKYPFHAVAIKKAKKAALLAKEKGVESLIGNV